ncbi:unnamed protein product [Caretta caretta]
MRNQEEQSRAECVYEQGWSCMAAGTLRRTGLLIMPNGPSSYVSMVCAKIKSSDRRLTMDKLQRTAKQVPKS